jgi:hypothetical protein
LDKNLENNWPTPTVRHEVQKNLKKVWTIMRQKSKQKLIKQKNRLNRAEPDRTEQTVNRKKTDSITVRNGPVFETHRFDRFKGLGPEPNRTDAHP